MQKSFFLHSTILLLAALSPAAIHAQFQAPTDAELKMTSDPKAPGADAVYLDIREIDNDRDEFESFYVRIKVLTEKGKELATVELPYLKGSEKISEIKARTIHTDGSVYPLSVKPEDLMVAKEAKFQIERRVFTLPNVQVGSILEYTYSLQYPQNQVEEPQWQIQRPYFVHHAYFEYTAFFSIKDDRGRLLSDIVFWNHLPPGADVKPDGHRVFRLEMTDIPPIPEEEWMPPIESLLYFVHFFYTSGRTEVFWRDAEQRWSKEVDKFAEPTKTLQDAVAGLVAPGDSDLDKAKKLYAAVQALNNTDYSRDIGDTERKELKLKEIRRAEDTWTQKTGSSEDIAMLYLAMLRAAGLTAYAAKIVDRDKGVFDPTYLSVDQLNSTLVILAVGGQEVLLDPGQPMCPFSTANWRHSAAAGLRESPDGGAFISTPTQEFEANSTSRVGDLYLAADGSLTGYFTVVMTGQEAMRWRQTSLENDATGLKAKFDRELATMLPDGVEAHIDHFIGIDQPDANLLAVVRLKGSLGIATARRLLVPGFFFETHGRVPFVNEEKRLEPVDMHYSERVTEQMTFHLPVGMTVEGAPPDASISWPGHAEFMAKSETQPGEITFTRVLSRAFTFAKPDEYQDLRGFYRKVAAADQAQLVFDLAPATKSN